MHNASTPLDCCNSRLAGYAIKHLQMVHIAITVLVFNEPTKAAAYLSALLIGCGLHQVQDIGACQQNGN